MAGYEETFTQGAGTGNRRRGPADPGSTAATRSRYNRIAPLYDLMQSLNERRFAPHRADLWSYIEGSRVLEVGVGTGVNIPLYPVGIDVTGVDLSPRMLDRARKRLLETVASVDLREADAQALPFPDASFDTVVATFVFCSVPDPVLGLSEIRRVLVPGGHFLMMEHVLSTRPILRQAMRLMNPMIVRMMGANIDRETVENVRRAGFVDLEVKDLGPLDIVKRIDARASGR